MLMIMIKQGLQRGNDLLLKVLGCVVATLLLAGCSAFSPRLTPGYVTQDDNFQVIRSFPGDTYKTLAKRIYGTSVEADRLSTINPELDPAGGTLIAAPRRVLNPLGVYPNGYRTMPILCYHRFTAANKSRSKLELTQHKVRQQLQYIADQGYHVIRMSDVEDYLQGRKEIPRRSVVITIDDGYRSTYDVLFPLLQEYEFPATIFVYTDFIGAPAALTWKQMKIMRDSGLVDIQSHSKSHASLVELTNSGPGYLKRLESEVRTPSKALEKRLGHPVDIFSYPYGDTNKKAVKALKKQGIRMAVTVNRGGNPSFANPYLLRRTMVYGDDTLASFKRKLQVFRRESFE